MYFPARYFAPRFFAPRFFAGAVGGSGTGVDVSVPIIAVVAEFHPACVNGKWRTADEDGVTADTTALTADRACSPLVNVGLTPIVVAVAFPSPIYIGQKPEGIDRPHIVSDSPRYRVVSATPYYRVSHAS
jgi:hypothetical protein